MLTGYGRSHYTMDPLHFGPHVITRGRGTFCWSGGRAEVGVGSVFALLPGVHVEYWEDPDDPWCYSWLHIAGSGIDGLARGCGFTPEVPVWRTDRYQDIDRAMRDAWDCLDPKKPSNAYVIQEKLYRFAAICARTSGALRQLYREGGLVKRAMALVDSQLHTGINVSEIASALKVSRTTLFNAFRKELGQSPVQWLQKRRIERAKDLLRAAGEVRVAGVALSCGFTDEKYFMRAFREMTGCTPSTWRRAALRHVT